MRRLLDADPGLVRAVDGRGQTAVHMAAWGGHTDTLGRCMGVGSVGWGWIEEGGMVESCVRVGVRHWSSSIYFAAIVTCEILLCLTCHVILEYIQTTVT